MNLKPHRARCFRKIEIMWSCSPHNALLRAHSFGALAAAAGGRFVRGVVLYLGERAAAKGNRLWAVPLPALWHQDGRRKAFETLGQQEDDILGLGGLGNF